ncbi:MAG: hypothetical protein EBW15_08975, partial [Actinobacteria bacterium]|nr:hypothetical protein [Actinomycetota bacterium]
LSGANTYSGATTVSAGAIEVANNTALGTTAGSTSVANGAQLQVAGGITSAEVISAAGVAVNQGVINNVSGSNTLSGAVTLTGSSSNEIQIDGGSLTFSGGITAPTDSDLVVHAEPSTTMTVVNSGISGSGVSIDKYGTGTLSINADSELSGGVIAYANGGTVQVGAAARLGSSGDYTRSIELRTGTTFAYASSANQTLSGVISGAGAVTKSSTGTLTLAAANSYTGTTTVSAGTLSVADASALGGAAAGQGTTIETAGTLAIGNTISLGEPIALSGTGAVITVASSESATVSSVISSTGALTKTGAGAPTPTAVADQLTLNGGTLSTTADFTLATTRGVTIGNSDGTINVATATTLTYDGVIAGASSSADFTKAGEGVLLLGGTNTFTGATLISQGTLRLANSPAAGSLSASSPMTVSVGATFDTNMASGQTTSIGSITGGGNIALGAGTLVASGSTDLTFEGIISGSGGLSKSGTGTLTLSGTNTYTGKTTITQGAISIAANSNLGAAPTPTAVADQLTLDGGTLIVTSDLTFSTTRGITLGSSNGTLSVASGKTLSYGGVVAGTGALTKAVTGSLVLSGVNTYSGATTISAGAVAVT